MVFSLTWLPEVLEAAGLKVAETPQWRGRGRGEMGRVRGVMCHHTATATPGNMPSLRLLMEGRADLSGPLAQLGLGRGGTFYVIAAGRANHAGGGKWEGLVTGNSSFIGIEAEHSGRPEEPWPAVQMDAYQRGVAAILKKVGADASMCCGHKEYALPKGRKPDPAFDMPAFRSEVAALLSGRTPPPLIPAADPKQRPTIRRGAEGEIVKEAQRLLKVKDDGDFGGGTEAAMREFQRRNGLVPDGIIGPRSWAMLAGEPEPDAPPSVAPPLRPAGPLPPADDVARPARVDGKVALGPTGERFASRAKEGFFTIGKTSLEAWLQALAAPPASVSASTRRVLRALCVNEGRLEAVNSYDGCFMSFGIFQWTAGFGDEAGELAVLLSTLKTSDAAAFEECFGRFGLDAQVSGPKAVTGQLLLDDKVLKTAAQKAVLRNVAWAYRFWRAGHHPSMRASQFVLAAARIDRFRTLPTSGRPLHDWVNSELGMAQLLDQHVNRPGHVPRTLEQAIGALFPAGPPDPAAWTTEDEDRLLDEYLELRHKTTMTDSEKRATRIAEAVVRRELSDARGSFR